MDRPPAGEPARAGDWQSIDLGGAGLREGDLLDVELDAAGEPSKILAVNGKPYGNHNT